MILSPDLLADSALVVIDFPAGPRKVWTAENILPVYVDSGFTLDELNDAQRHIHEVALPNALRLVALFRARSLPCVFAHWADQAVPAGFAPREGEPVVPKTQMDAFCSSNIQAVLDEIAPRRLWMCGGHTQGCLGETARSALARGYPVICIRDATFDCSAIRWPTGIDAVDYHHVCCTADVLALD